MASRDFAFEALAEVTNTDWTTGRGELNKALKDIRQQSPEIVDGYLLSCEIHDRAQMYAVVMGDEILLTPSALAKHWLRVKEQMPKARPATASPSPDIPTPGAGGQGVCETCNGDTMVLVAIRPSGNPASGFEEMAPCPDCNSHANAEFWRADGSRFRSPDPAIVRARMNS
jgi:hypothetical protein